MGITMGHRNKMNMLSLLKDALTGSSAKVVLVDIIITKTSLWGNSGLLYAEKHRSAFCFIWSRMKPLDRWNPINRGYYRNNGEY